MMAVMLAAKNKAESNVQVQIATAVLHHLESKHAVHIDTRCADIEAVRQKMSIYWERLEAVPYQKPPWSERYPELVNIVGRRLGYAQAQHRRARRRRRV